MQTDAKAPFSTCGGIGMIFSNILARHFSSGKLVCPLFVKSLDYGAGGAAAGGSGSGSGSDVVSPLDSRGRDD